MEIELADAVGAKEVPKLWPIPAVDGIVLTEVDEIPGVLIITEDPDEDILVTFSGEAGEGKMTIGEDKAIVEIVAEFVAQDDTSLI